MLQLLEEAMVRLISAKDVDERYHFSWRKCCGSSFLHLPRLDYDLACLTEPGSIQAVLT